MPRGVAKVPQVMQMEALECGAACLTMVLAYYGKWEPLEEVRERCGVSRDGSNAYNVLMAGQSYGLKGNGVSCTAERLRERNQFPCIVFWEFNHFVVVDGFSGDKVYLNDPARGEVQVPLERFEESFTGIALTFEPTDEFEPGGTPPSPLAFARKRLRGLKAPIAFVMATAAAASLLGVFSTNVAKVFADYILSGAFPEWTAMVVTVMLAITVASGAVSILNAVMLVHIQGQLAVASSSRFMRHLLHLPSGFFAQRQIGDLQQRQTSNEGVAFSLVGKLAPVLVNAVMIVLYLVVMLQYSIPLTVLGVISALANIFVARYTSKKRVNLSRSAAANSGKFYAVTMGGIEMIETIKASGSELGYFQRWAGYQAATSEDQASLARVNAYLGTAPAVVSGLVNVAVLVLGIWLIIAQGFTAGGLLAFQGALGAFSAPLASFVGLGQTIQEMRTQMERIDDVLRYPADVPYDEGASEGDGTGACSSADADEGGKAERRVNGRTSLAGTVDVSGLTFGYSPLEDPLIKNFDLHLEPGQWVALVGGSGCGKSTLAKLVSGLYKPWEGEVRFDGVPLDEVDRRVLRSSLAVVDQNIVTFDDSVADNVRLWDRSVEDFEVIMACRDAEIHDVVAARPGGYGARIMPRGQNFSGGQLQRLEIARALALDPSIVILDEATSALDAKTEERVIQRIRARGATCIVVAHRLSTIRDCDEIVVLDRGSVVERGMHEQLMAANGAYADLVRSE